MGVLYIKELDRVEVLRLLINNAKASCDCTCKTSDVSYEDAKELFEANQLKYFHNYKCIKLRINLNGHILYTSQYDEIYGASACFETLKHLLLN